MTRLTVNYPSISAVIQISEIVEYHPPGVRG